MRTRSRGPASPLPSSPPPTDPKPRGKRRSTAHQAAAVKHEQDGDGSEAPVDRSNNEEAEDDDCIILTPRKKDKRVRFSDPGTVHEAALADGSTGLTPSLKRTRLSPSAKSAGKKRRVTLPPRLNLSPTPLPVIEEIQFAPLKQVLDSRMRRRLRRSHLSEEINNIEEQNRDDEKTQRELAQLRAQGHDSEERIKGLMFELESQRQLGIEVNAEEEANRQAMAEELQRLKQDLSAPKPLVAAERLPVNAPTEVDSDEDLWDEPGSNENSSPTMFAFSSSSPLLPASSPATFSSPLTRHQAGIEATVRADDEALRASRDMSEQLETAARQASDAQAALRTLRNDLSRLGFAEGGNESPDDMILSIQDAFRRTRLELEHLLPGETPSGFENSLLLPAMVDHVRNLLADLHESHRTAASLRQSESALRGQFNSTLAKLADVDNRMTVVLAQRHDALSETKRKEQTVKELQCAASAHASIVQDRDGVIDGMERELRAMQQQLDGSGTRSTTLEAELKEKTVDIDRLKKGLESYRTEVSSLECLVGGLEDGKEEATGRSTKLQREVDELKMRNEELVAKNTAVEKDLGETRGFLTGHVARSRCSLEGTVQDHEKVWQAAEEFLGRHRKAVAEVEQVQ